MMDFAEHLQEALGANYQLDRELTGGGMSRVFVAVDRVLGRNVVVKVLPPELAAGVNRDRFRREIQVAAQLQHPHIVPLLSAGEHGDLLWYTMPYIDGESLRAALERNRKFTIREVIRITHDVVDALSFAHERGVIHRDIKPANILSQGSHALVTDFGVAKAISAALPLSGVTSAGIAIGTPAYMAPEQLAGDANADHRMDIYAVGLLTYELITGVSPFSGPSPRETLAAQLTRDPKPLYEISGDVPRTLSDLVMRCLAKDPEARPQSAGEILQELDAMTMPLGSTPRGGGVDAPTRTDGSRRVWAALGITVLVAAAFGVGYSVTHRDTSPVQVNVSPPSISIPAPAVPSAESLSKIARAAVAQALPLPPALPVKPVRPLITHADSMRIAEAVRKKMDAAKVKDSSEKARIAEETQRKMTDSVIAANSGSATVASSGPRRVVIVEPTDVRAWPEATILGRAVADSLRRVLRARPKQYLAVEQDSVRGTLGRTRDINEVLRSLNSDLLVSISLRPMPHDSAMLMLQAYDATANNSYRSRTVTNRVVAKNEVLANLDTLLLSLLTYLDEMTRAPRRAQPQPPGV